MRNSELKLLINQAYEAAEALYETPYGQYFANKGIKPFQELLMIDLMKYVAYLGNIKGFATEREVVLFKDCYIEQNSYIGIRQAQAALDSNLEGNTFGTTIPFLLSAYCLIDIEFYNNGIDLNGTGSRLYIDLFKDIGQFFLEYHGTVDNKEANVVYKYIELLENTRNEKLSNIISKNTLNEKADEVTNAGSVSNGYSVDNKKDILLNNFEIIKGDYENSRSMADIIIKMLEIDVDTAIEMWSYLLTIYESQAMWYSYDLTGAIMIRGGNAIGQDEMDNIVLTNPLLKKILITKKCALRFGGALELIRRKIQNDELHIADELLESIYGNQDREDSWYDVMNGVMPYCNRISKNAYELLEMWCDRVQNQEEKAKLSIRMLNYVD